MTSDHDLPELPEDPELERATRDLLRNDPVDLDVDRRERAVAAALAAADQVEGLAGPAAAVVHDLRSRRAARRDTLRPVLVAPAALVVVAAGVFAVAELGNGSSTEDMAAEGAAFDESGPTSGADRAAEPESAPDEGAGRPDQGAAATTTLAAGPLPDLGDHPDAEAVLDVARPAAGFDTSQRDVDATTAESAPAVQDLTTACAAGLDGVPVATASVAGAPVVVALLPDETTVVVRVADCVELGRR